MVEVTSNTSRSIEMRDIWKQYGELVALGGVDLSLKSGEVHAVLGENGAGKTTLMSVLGGIIQPDLGQIVVDGVERKIKNPKTAGRYGIGMVHQHFKLVERFSVAENLHIGWEQTPKIAGPGDLVKRAAEISERFDMKVDVEARVGDLSVGEQQLVEILKVLSRGAEIIILDEPTAVLTPQESDSLFRTLRTMADAGSAVMFISHKLREVVGHADVVTVMRRGKKVAELKGGESDTRKLARLMIGRELQTPTTGTRARVKVEASLPKMVVEGVSARDDRGLMAVRDVGLTIRSGEIVGVVGVAGNGQTELAEVLTGMRAIESGKITVSGRDLSGRGAEDFIGAGVGHVPEDRMGVGLLPEEPIWRNVTLRTYRRRPILKGRRIDFGEAKRSAERVVEATDLSVKDITFRTGSLSGGNAQRLLIGRELEAKPEVLIAFSPSRGVDVGAAERVHGALLEARTQGMGILMITEDLDEVLAVADRVIALFEGSIVGSFGVNEIDAEKVGLLIGGGA